MYGGWRAPSLSRVAEAGLEAVGGILPRAHTARALCYLAALAALQMVTHWPAELTR